MTDRPMDELIDDFIQRMEQRYQPSDAVGKQIRTMLDTMRDLPLTQVQALLDQVEQTYEGHASIRSCPGRDGLTAVGRNLKKIARDVAIQGKHIERYTESIKKVEQAQECSQELLAAAARVATNHETVSSCLHQAEAGLKDIRGSLEDMIEEQERLNRQLDGVETEQEETGAFLPFMWIPKTVKS